MQLVKCKTSKCDAVLDTDKRVARKITNIWCPTNQQIRARTAHNCFSVYGTLCLKSTCKLP